LFIRLDTKKKESLEPELSLNSKQRVRLTRSERAIDNS
jgi:hypothetical protein